MGKGLRVAYVAGLFCEVLPTLASVSCAGDTKRFLGSVVAKKWRALGGEWGDTDTRYDAEDEIVAK